MPRHGSLRASDADREDVIERLRLAAAEGRLTSDELADRVSAALCARTYAELAATVVDLPDPARRQPVVSRRRAAAGWTVTTVRAYPALLVVLIPLLAVTGTMLLAFTTMWMTMLILLTVCGLRGAQRLPGPWALERPASTRHRPTGRR